MGWVGGGEGLSKKSFEDANMDMFLKLCLHDFSSSLEKIFTLGKFCQVSIQSKLLLVMDACSDLVAACSPESPHASIQTGHPRRGDLTSLPNPLQLHFGQMRSGISCLLSQHISTFKIH